MADDESNLGEESRQNPEDEPEIEIRFQPHPVVSDILKDESETLDAPLDIVPVTLLTLALAACCQVTRRYKRWVEEVNKKFCNQSCPEMFIIRTSCGNWKNSMKSRWEKPVFQQVVIKLDPAAVRGQEIMSLAELDQRVFDGRPEAHLGSLALELQEVYETLARSVREEGRLGEQELLVKQWKLTGDIYSPKLKRFIEVDEAQHFSQVRLARILANRSASWAPIFPDHFWEKALPRLLKNPRKDLCPPCRDEPAPTGMNCASACRWCMASNQRFAWMSFLWQQWDCRAFPISSFKILEGDRHGNLFQNPKG